MKTPGIAAAARSGSDRAAARSSAGAQPNNTPPPHSVRSLASIGATATAAAAAAAADGGKDSAQRLNEASQNIGQWEAKHDKVASNLAGSVNEDEEEEEQEDEEIEEIEVEEEEEEEGQEEEEEEEEEEGIEEIEVEVEVEEEEEEEEEEEVEEMEEIEFQEDASDEGEAEEVEEVGQEDEVEDLEQEEVFEEEELEAGQEQEGEGDEEIEYIEEIEYVDEFEEEEIKGKEEEQEGAGEEEMQDEQEEADKFAQEYPEAQEAMPVSERQKRKKMEVFVGGLDRDATEEDLKKVFERVGEVKEVRLMKSIHTGKNKGFAFVRYATAAQAQHAASALERVQVRGRVCGVVPSEENDILFIGNLNKHWNKETVIETLKKHGLDYIEELTIMEDPQNAGMNRGFAFVEFSTHEDARTGFRRLQRPDVYFGTDRPAKVAWANPVNEPESDVMAQVKSVFVDGMPTTWDEERAKEHFGQYGEVERIVLARNMPFSKRTDFGFVNYTARESALACIEAMNNAELVDGDTKMKVRARLSKPQLKITKKIDTGLQDGYHMGWHRGRLGHRGRFFRGADAGWGWGVEAGWDRGFDSGRVRGAGRFSFGRGRARFGRGFSRGILRGSSFGGRFQHIREKPIAQHLLHASKEQTAQDDLMSDRPIINDQKENASISPAEVVLLEQGGSSGEKFECPMCSFASDVESEFNAHQISRVHKVFEGMRREGNLNNETPSGLLHEYASRHRCEVHYDIASESALGPFEVFATIRGGNTGIRSTCGVGRGRSKAKARHMAAAATLEKILDRVPDLKLGRPARSRQQTFEHQVAENSARTFPTSRPRSPSSSGSDFNKRHYEGNLSFSGGYGTSPAHRGKPTHARGRWAHGHDTPYIGIPRTRNVGLGREFEGREARSYGRGATRSRYSDNGEFYESVGGQRGKNPLSGHNVLTAHREAYFQHLEQSNVQGYGSNRHSAAIPHYREAISGAKRSISAVDDDPRTGSIPQRSHSRARVEHFDHVPVAPGGSKYASGSLYATSESALQEDPNLDAQPYGLYSSHQSALDMAGVYPSSSHSYATLYGDASNIHDSAELIAGSRYPTSLQMYTQGQFEGGSYSVGEPGTGMYY